MFLNLKNIGKISSADIELKGITVIAGENSTGKSTVGKVLFAIFNSFYNFESSVNSTRSSLLAQEIESSFDEYTESSFELDSKNVVEMLFELYNDDININTIRDIIEKNVYYNFVFDDDDENESFVSDDDYLEKVLNLFLKYREIPDDVIFQNIFNRKIRNEFYSQISNIYSTDVESKISLTIKDKTVSVHIKNNKVVSVNNTLSLKNEILYLDDPFILDHLPVTGNSYREFYRATDVRKRHLSSKLTYMKETSDVEEAFNELIINEHIEEIINKINSVCDGLFTYKPKEGFVYSFSDISNNIRIGNLSLGLKTFVIIKTLLTNGSLKKNGTIILDEPEIHLHPQWQLLLAEIIVLLQKEFGLHILLTTHSPYFLEAIEVYSEKYKISDKCKFYLAENFGKVSKLVDVTEDTERIYKKLAYPFQILENERYNND